MHCLGAKHARLFEMISRGNDFDVRHALFLAIENDLVYVVTTDTDPREMKRIRHVLIGSDMRTKPKICDELRDGVLVEDGALGIQRMKDSLLRKCPRHGLRVGIGTIHDRNITRSHTFSDTLLHVCNHPCRLELFAGEATLFQRCQMRILELTRELGMPFFRNRILHQRMCRIKKRRPRAVRIDERNEHGLGEFLVEVRKAVERCSLESEYRLFFVADDKEIRRVVERRDELEERVLRPVGILVLVGEDIQIFLLHHESETFVA